LRQLEAEAIAILREVAETAENPVMLYSMGKDSSVLLHLARKAFYPEKPPMPLLHIDSTWEFREMTQFRDRHIRDELGLDVRVYVNREGLAAGVNPFDHSSRVYTDVMRTQALRQALDHYRFDAALGGGRRDEERSRAKERVFSFRDRKHRWDPKNQRPELWNLYNTWVHRGESIRVFPLSNWTELDVWQYILVEQIPLVPLYFAAERPVVQRDGDWIMVDDERMRLQPGETPEARWVRFRTLGCYPVTGAVESRADSVLGIVHELLTTRHSERQGRAIDRDEEAAMERKKREGYF
jgi:sulfate adenylyltransferase subunit 2